LVGALNRLREKAIAKLDSEPHKIGAKCAIKLRASGVDETSDVVD
jgi:hypothetical protein